MGVPFMLCKVEGCNQEKRKLGYCQKHYQRFKKYGSTENRKWSQAPLEERFWMRVDKRGPEECWEWAGQKINGYGRISLGKKSEGSDGAHRLSWLFANKGQSIPTGMHIMHSCDNPGCVNPSHLSIGTPKENAHDMIRKGRKRVVAPVGEGNGKSLINAEIVRQIKQSTDSHAALARRFNVSPNCIRGVRIGRTWSHVT
jgi:hypothetical protein